MATSTVIPINTNRLSKVIDDCQSRSSTVEYKDLFYSSLLYSIPFKIRVTNITVPGYGPTNVPPIGIAIIGFNNYIL
jgi:hypothetical protein